MCRAGAKGAEEEPGGFGSGVGAAEAMKSPAPEVLDCEFHRRRLWVVVDDVDDVD